jgi:hypothetical protein
MTIGLQFMAMSTTHRVRKTVSVALLCAAAVVGQSVSSNGVPTVQAAGTLGSGGEYHPVTPTRIFETRGAGINDVAPLGKKPTSVSGSTFSIDVLGQGGIPAEVAGLNRDVLAVVVNITVIDPTSPGYLSVSPKGAAIGQSSLINFGTNENVPNLAVVGAGADGGITMSLVTPAGAGAASVAVDVFGWIAKTDYPDADDSGARFVPAGPGRILDTRSNPVPAGWTSGQALGSDARLVLPVRGADAVSPTIADIVPNDPNVTGVMVNITAVNGLPGSQDTFVSATPNAIAAGAQPGTSNTNLRAGQNKANMAIVPIGADGNIHLYNAAGATHLIVDVLGYLVRGMSADSTTGRVVPLDSPFRVFDTRLPEFGSAPLGYNTAESWSFKAFSDSVTIGGVPLGAQSAVLGNLTGTGLSRLYPTVPVTTYMTMYPGGATKPESSNINVAEGQTVPNMSLLRYGTSGTDPNVIQAFNFDGSIHYLLDVYAVVLS